MSTDRPSRLLVVLMIVALSAPALATTSRVRSLGGFGDYFEDDSNVLRWYGSLVDYANEVALEVGDWNHDGGLPDGYDRVKHQGGGLHLRFDPEGRWGIGAAYFSSDLPDGDPGGFFAALWAKKFGALDAGLYFRGTSYGSAANTPQLGDLRGLAQYFHDFGGGLRLDLGEGAYGDIAGEVRQTRFEYDDLGNDITIKESSTLGGGVRARAFIGVNERVALVPVIDYTSDHRPTRMDVMADVADLDGWQVRAGSGLNLLLDPDNLVIASVEYLDHHRGWRARHLDRALYGTGWHDVWFLNTRFALESRLLPWLTLRAGARYVRQTDESYFRHDNGDGTADVLYHWDVSVTVPVTVGVGVHFGAFDGDLLFNDDLPSGSGYLVTGADDEEQGHFSSLTLRYLF